MATSTKSQNITRELMHFVSSKRDIEEYLEIYGRPGTVRTAVIKIGGDIIEHELDVLVKSLLFLQEAGLMPVVVHGAGPQMNELFAKAKVEPKYVDGSRVTDKETLQIAKKVFFQVNTKLVDAIVKAGGNARPITNGVFEAKLRNLNVYGLVGDVERICEESIASAINCNQIPILSCLGESNDGQTLNINADIAARELAIKLQPHKTIFVSSKGGWIEEDGTKLKEIVMNRDYDTLASRDYTGRQGTLLKLNEINTLLQALPLTSSVALTSASDLSREILSSCSTGTICVRGQKALQHERTQSVERHGHSKKFRVGLLGARGYVGREMIRLIGRHSHLELVCASSRALNDQKVIDIATSPPLNPHTNEPAIHSPFMNEHLNISHDLRFCTLDLDNISTSPYAKNVDVWILALPNGHCEKYAYALDKIECKKLIVDLSADQRFNPDWVYGLPESPRKRDMLANATHIANPGCYATGAQLGLLPLLGSQNSNGDALINLSIPPHIFGLSGYSGAGTGLLKANNPAVLHDNIMAYRSVNHIHEQEISHQLGTRVCFMPHVAPFFQGIHLTISTQLKDGAVERAEDVYRLFKQFYADEPLIQIVAEIPIVKDNAQKHHAVIGGFQLDEKTGRLVMVVTIDNLLKGAATQAIQNINLALGIQEQTGIRL
uniref:acetylglutamate kinase n=1 Tax=Albugo laibachii Nc14 TaxID=890382 RepID=F0W4J9_9STRA|nr:conserved hypothetical protein [Albugo laibachii Nc14]|eukprot:CCA16032.1 conserved hypothetical protein [Albugo laibachii Nc14]